MLKKYLLTFLGIVITLLLIFLGVRSAFKAAEERIISQINIGGIQLFMTESEVQALLGQPLPSDPHCMGCEMTFVYPQFQLSGRYSDTLYKKLNDNARDPLVKEIATENKEHVVLGVHLGRTSMPEAEKILLNHGFKKITKAYELGNLRIAISEDSDIVGKMFVSYTVAEDLDVLY